MRYPGKLICLYLSLLPAFLLVSCKKDKILNDTSAKLEFSSEKILYDTVFTTIGSTTKYIKVYNRHSQKLIISSIRLGGGVSSRYRFNIDGIPGPVVRDLEIPAKDSLWVFVEVTINPNQQNTPLIVTDSLIFETNGNFQNVLLEAWGQDANYFNGQILCNQVWNNNKPYLIYNSILVDSLCTLTINPGCKIHFHKGSALLVKGTLIVNGDRNNKVVFQGDRLEAFYANAPDQWYGIWLMNGSRDNTINGAVIKNAFIGIRADTMNYSANPTLSISNSQVTNHAAACLYGVGSRIRAWNTIFANAGQYVAALAIGGDYNFYHCTFANYWTFDNRQTPTLLINNYYKDINEVIQTRPLDSANFYNCIIYGDKEEELKLDRSTNTGPPFRYKFHHCNLKTQVSTPATNFISPVVNDPVYFRNPGNFDFRPGSLSNAINRGDMNVITTFLNGNLNLDFAGLSRITDGPPDNGAFEYYP
jgi:hypothetical protein